MYEVKCKDSNGFEDQLTAGMYYAVGGRKNNSVLIKNDQGQTRWYGMMHFEV